MLVTGGLCDKNRGDQDSWVRWREALWHLGSGALQQKHRQIAMSLQEWSLNSVSADWGRQLVEMEETLGWCTKNLDAVRAAPSSLHCWGFPSTDHPDLALAAGHEAAAVNLPPAPAWALLPPDARRKVRSLETERYERALDSLQGGRSLRQVLNERVVAASVSKVDMEICHHVGSRCVSENNFISFSNFRHTVESIPELPHNNRPWKAFPKIQPKPTKLKAVVTGVPALRELHVL